MASPGCACGNIVRREADLLCAGLCGYREAEFVCPVECSGCECCRNDDGAFVDIDGCIGECRFEGCRWRIDDPLRHGARKYDGRRNQVIVRGRVCIDLVTRVSA